MTQPAKHPKTGITQQGRSAYSPQRALQRCMRQLVQARVSALACRDAEANEEPGVLVVRLARLQTFLSADRTSSGVGAPPGRQRSATTANAPLVSDPLVELLRWQIRLELVELATEAPALSRAAALLRPLLQQQLETLGRLCAASLWTPAHFITSGLARHWRQAHVLALFCPAEASRRAIAGLEADCLRLHLNASLPEAACTAGLLRELARCVEQPFVPPLEPDPGVAAALLDAELLFAAELSRYRQLLTPMLAISPHEELEPAEQLLTVLYKLAWVSEACRPGPLALAWRCAYQLCSEFWFQHRALPPEVNAGLQSLLAITAAGPAENAPDSASQAAWLYQTQLLRQWPIDAADASLPIALAANAADAPRVVSLEAVPLLLSDSFATLVEVSRDWFAARASHTADLTSLLQELALLEKGAAAVKVWSLEHLCTLLLNVYGLVERDGIALPIDLLTSAHVDLVRLLDQAAAWQETSPDAAVIDALQQWIAGAAASRPELTIAAPTPAEVAAAQLYQALLVYVRTLTLVAEKPVRLHVDADNEVLPPQVVLQVAEALKPLLRFVLLDNASAAYSRRAAHKPLVHTVSIHLRREAGVLWIMLEEDNEGPLPTPAQTRQLQRSLPRTAGALGCELHPGQGRWFSFTLAEVSE